MNCRLLLLPVALAACSQTPPATSPAPSTSTVTATAAASTAAATDTGLLNQYLWQLNDATDSKGKRIDALFVRADKPVELHFSADRLNVVNSCNNMGGGYSIKNGRLLIGPMMRTMMACPDAALDDATAERLQGSLKLNLQTDGNAPRLQLVTDSGDALSFTGLPTAETRFGGPGEIAFLEVAAQTAPCTHPPVPGKQCLLVRERHFDEQGLPAGTPGAWQPLHQDIEGYTHEAGIRNVLRVKRYPIRNAPADAPSTAYVLDIVVESEKVGD